MKKKNKEYKRVNLPHIGYTVIFQDLKYLRGVPVKGGAYTVTTDSHTSYVFIQDIEKSVKQPFIFPTIAHEIVHVLQNICEARIIEFTSDKEHMAYIAHYLLNTLLGYEYWKEPPHINKWNRPIISDISLVSVCE